MRRSVRGALTAGLSATVLLTGTTMASADPTPTPAPSYKQVTLSPEESQKLCADRLPKMIARRDKLAQRISGGADVKGSVAWLRARAAKQKEKGHDKAAAALEKRAERRSDRLKQLGTMKTKLETFKAAHCQVAK
ncbi:hypothetical protein AB0E69_38850 [Kribbella sp. NPDC026611]|uniref:hypothetical protein n=1 Tax=Kribbella sp. NPDC026611 TaxID=3154911 RepID=UPI0033D84051